jgi:hypothetical protein
MSTLDILAQAANDCKPLTTWNKRYNNLVKARAKMAEIRAQRKAGTYVPKPKLKKVIDPNWRLKNIKKAQEARAKKIFHKKLMAQDTEPESDGDPEEEEVTA